MGEAMISVKLEEVNEFMNGLFINDMFDRFEVTEAEVKTLFTTKISGRVNSAWLDTGEVSEEYILWKQLKTIVYDLIKGKKTPLLLNICFSYQKENKDRAIVRIQFEEKTLRIITGYSAAGFSLDKSEQIEWDDNFLQFLRKHGFTYEEQ